MNVNLVKTQSIFSPSKLPDTDYVINPYIGCNHGCIYCYAEYMTRFTGHTGEKWGDFMDIKEGYSFPKASSLTGKTILLGSATDPYNPLEKKYEKTRRVLEGFADSGARIQILTKSPLVLRDLDLLTKMDNIRVGVSFSTLDPDFARLIECHAAGPAERLDTMRRLSEAGVAVFGFLSPIFPLLSDYRATALETGKYAGCLYFENLNLRGLYKQAVLNLVKTHFPRQYKAFSLIYRSKVAFTEYWESKAEEIENFMETSMKGKPYKLYFFHDKIKKH